MNTLFCKESQKAWSEDSVKIAVYITMVTIHTTKKRRRRKSFSVS